MTKTQFIKKFKEMRKEHNQELLKEAIRLFECGGVNTPEYKDDFLLPKVIMYVALRNEADQYTPFKGSGQEKVIKNLSHF